VNVHLHAGRVFIGLELVALPRLDQHHVSRPQVLDAGVEPHARLALEDHIDLLVVVYPPRYHLARLAELDGRLLPDSCQMYGLETIPRKT